MASLARPAPAPAPATVGLSLLQLERSRRRGQSLKQQTEGGTVAIRDKDGGQASDTVEGNDVVNNNRAPTGCACIDQALEGGFKLGEITSIAASDSNVKTLISYHTLTSHLLARSESEAIMIDTTGAFAVQTLRDVAVGTLQRQRSAKAEAPLQHQGYVYQHPSAASNATPGPEDDLAVTRLLDRVKLVRVFDLAGLTDIVGEISQLFRDQGKTGFDATRDESSGSEVVMDLLIVDDLSAIFQPIMARNNVEAQSLLTSFHRSLAHLVRSHSIATLLFRGVAGGKRIMGLDGKQMSEDTIDDQASRFPSTPSRPALGKTIAHLIDLDILIVPFPKNRDDAEVAFAVPAKPVAQEWEELHMMEILSDKSGSRHRNLAAFKVKGTDLDGLPPHRQQPS